MSPTIYCYMRRKACAIQLLFLTELASYILGTVMLISSSRVTWEQSVVTVVVGFYDAL